ncbi:MAG: A24 family peptidase [Acetobacterales bacterium]
MGLDPGFDLFAVVAAPFVGSFLATLTLRWPDWRGALTGRSACPHCRTPLSPRDLVPLLSWLWLGGECRHCEARIDRRYPLFELAATGIALWAALTLPAGHAPVACLLGWSLLALAAIDLRHFVLPDAITLPLMGSGLLVAAATGGTPALATSAFGALLGYMLLAATAAIYLRLRGRDGLGLGDAKLLAAAGAWVGWYGLGAVLLAAIAAALAIATLRWRRGLADGATPIAFGPYLAAATWIGALHGPLLG